MAAAPFAAVFSTVRLFAVEFPLTAGPFAAPPPDAGTGGADMGVSSLIAAVAAAAAKAAAVSPVGLRYLPPPCNFLLTPSPSFLTPSWSSKSESACWFWFLRFFFAAPACFRYSDLAAASSTSCCATADILLFVPAPSRRARSLAPAPASFPAAFA